MPNITLLNQTDKLRIRITFGQALLGGYRVGLWDAAGANATPIASGHNGDLVPDEFSVPVSPANLVHETFEIDLAVANPGGAPPPGSTYSVTIDFLQGGTPVTGSPFVIRGPFTSSPLFLPPAYVQVT